MMEWIAEIVVDTIVAAALTLLCYIIGLDESWQDASRTFFVAFLVMFLMGAYRKYKKGKE
ncbi:hypothetical protein L6472_03285 [Prevotella sp. E13-17]|uniref:hypothetical protein n=1 Tax=Prevotella sp. E13-17 TaxID=2913616 RepID=UPI001EDAA838|nr:hypothetical protein [Prevotella sp. E13-17]UKK51630.1 hypothetical protein L6472_03285 [Prevotella sp. E13-17]